MNRTPSLDTLTKSVQTHFNSVVGATASKDAVTAHEFFRAYVKESWSRKFSGSADPDVLHEKAIASFKELELVNRETNNRFRKLAFSGPALFCLDEARRKIAFVLGSFDPREFAVGCNWGPGSTATLTSQEATQDQKILERRLSVSRRAMKYASLFLRWDYHWFEARTGIFPSGEYSVLPSEFLITDSERFTTVEKDESKRRPISIQATMNLFLQKGVGHMIRRRLRRCGIDLDDQSRNQWLASVAHRCGYATIDLQNASDTVSFELVRYLLPDDWFQVLADLRHSSCKVAGEDVHLEKFSAMGNGYTFELESLIFYALICAVERRFGLSTTKGVYGDDLVVDTSIASGVIRLLNECGFTVNASKTFTEGLFYESCGKHYFNGVDVTPPFQKEQVIDLHSAVRAANRILRCAVRSGGGVVFDNFFYRPWLEALKCVKFHLDAKNASRWIRAVESGKEAPAPLPFPLIPYGLDDDRGVLAPRDLLQFRNGKYSFPTLTIVAISHDGEGSAVFSNYLRRFALRCHPDSTPQTTLFSKGLVSPRDKTKTIHTTSSCWQSETCEWPENWPLPRFCLGG